jgi:hypothetical protein
VKGCLYKLRESLPGEASGVIARAVSLIDSVLDTMTDVMAVYLSFNGQSVAEMGRPVRSICAFGKASQPFRGGLL